MTAPSPGATPRVHPRVCGETRGRWWRSSFGSGPSPRVRGNPELAGAHAVACGSIPACAGKPGVGRRRGRKVGVHPRVCGETFTRPRTWITQSGPSPRVRGNHPQRQPATEHPGSIPACAGKPRGEMKDQEEPGVHPRVCGETFTRPRTWITQSGPSPRVRGNHPQRQPATEHPGSIPACAGKPRGEMKDQEEPGVHPRVCGETVAPRCRGRH